MYYYNFTTNKCSKTSEKELKGYKDRLICICKSERQNASLKPRKETQAEQRMSRALLRNVAADAARLIRRNTEADPFGKSGMRLQSRPQLHGRAKETGLSPFSSSSCFVSGFCSSSSSSSSASVSKIGFVGWYLGMVKSRPVLTKSVTSSLIYIAADLSSQVPLFKFWVSTSPLFWLHVSFRFYLKMGFLFLVIWFTKAQTCGDVSRSWLGDLMSSLMWIEPFPMLHFPCSVLLFEPFTLWELIFRAE